MTESQLSSIAEWQLKLERMHADKIKLGLDRVAVIADRLGLRDSRQSLAGRVITVGGTNGKGSTVCFLEQMLLRSGYRVGAYTSPHVRRFNERIRIMGEPVDDVALGAALEVVESARQQTELTYFEFTTLTAMVLFKQNGLDYALLEVGLGGRLDAVNVVDPALAIITTIALDHQAWLGETRELIAREKAGILRAGCEAICGDPDPPEALLDHASALEVELKCIDQDFGFELTDDDSWRFWSHDAGSTDLAKLPIPRLPLSNAAIALQALVQLKVDVTPEIAHDAISNAKLDGRYQRSELRNNNGQPIRVIFDVAHNPEAVAYLKNQLREEPIDGEIIAICALLADKDADTIAALMSDTVDQWLLPQLQAERALQPALLRASLANCTDAIISECADVAEALSEVRKIAQADDLVIIFGSFYTVSEGLEVLERVY